MRLVRKTIQRKLAVVLLVVLAFAGIAAAQDTLTFDPAAWGSDPKVALVALAGAVAWLRQTRFGAGIDGPVRVAAATGLVGAVGGAALQLFGFLAVAPYAAHAAPWGGVLYGLALAFTAVTGVSLFVYGAGKLRPKEQPAVADWLLAQLRQIVPTEKLPAAVTAVMPLLMEFAQSPALLTDDVRADVQARMLTLLRRAGLLGVDL